MTDTVTPNLITLDTAAQAQLFTDARTANTFTDEPVTDAQLRAIFDLAKCPPTADEQPSPCECSTPAPAKPATELLTHMAEGNRAKTATAPVVAVLAADTDSANTSPDLPDPPRMRERLAADAAARDALARFNAALQIGYWLLAVRAAGLAAGPMAGFEPPQSTTTSSPTAPGAPCSWSTSASPAPTPGSPACPASTTTTSSATPDRPRRPARVARRPAPHPTPATDPTRHRPRRRRNHTPTKPTTTNTSIEHTNTCSIRQPSHHPRRVHRCAWPPSTSSTADPSPTASSTPPGSPPPSPHSTPTSSPYKKSTATRPAAATST